MHRDARARVVEELDGWQDLRDAGEAIKTRTGRHLERLVPALEKALEEALGLSVSIGHRANGSGEVKIGYKTLEQLDSVARDCSATE